MRPGVLRAALVAASLAAPRAAVASAAPVLNLEWTAPAACPRGDEVREMASALLGAPVSARGVANTQVRARVRANAGGFVLTIETRSSSGTDRRRLQDTRCVVLAEAAALIAAAAADPSLAPAGAGPVNPGTKEPASGATSEAAVVPPAPEPEQDSGVVPPAPELPPGPDEASEPPGTGAPGLAPGTGAPVLAPGTGAPGLAPGTGAPGLAPVEGPDLAPVEVPDLSPGTAAPVAARPRTRFGLRLGGLFDVGSVPGPTGGLALGGAVFGRLWRAELEGMWLAARTAEPRPDLGARVTVFAGAVRGCVVPAVGRLEVPVCGQFEAGMQRGRGVGSALASPGKTDDVPWLALGAGPGLTWAVRPWLALSLRLAVVVPLRPARFEARQPDGEPYLVHQGAPVAGRAALAVEWRFR